MLVGMNPRIEEGILICVFNSWEVVTLEVGQGDYIVVKDGRIYTFNGDSWVLNVSFVSAATSGTLKIDSAPYMEREQRGCKSR